MSEIKVDIGNVSQFMPAIRKAAKGKVLTSVNAPGVRREINFELYMLFKDDLPFQTGALQDSPLFPTPQIHYGLTAGDMPKRVYRWANGDITDDGITFNPFEKSKDGDVHYYASYIKGLNLNARIRQSTAKKKQAIAEVLLRNINNE